jgi:hypothetical protein
VEHIVARLPPATPHFLLVHLLLRQVVRVADEADYLSALVEEGQKVIAEKAAR